MKRLYSIGFLLAVLLTGRGVEAVSSAPAGKEAPAGAEVEDTSILLSAPTELSGSVNVSVAMAFCPSMGCYDVNCTDAGHYHACGATCTDASHYHNCPENCAEAEHHHAAAYGESGAPAFMPSMGCYDVNCTDAGHYHACGATCTDASHYHHCPENCIDTAHSHCEQRGSGHHGGHHGGHHRQ